MASEEAIEVASEEATEVDLEVVAVAIEVDSEEAVVPPEVESV